MNDDLAVPTALAGISESLRLGNTAITDGDKKAIAQHANEIRGALEVLGCDPFDSVFAQSGATDLTAALDGTIKLALAQRTAARERKDFAASDEQQPFLSLLCFLSLSLSLSLSTETVSTLALKADAATATVPKEKVAKQRIANIFFIVLLF
jgi:hypothetical protein